MKYKYTKYISLLLFIILLSCIVHSFYYSKYEKENFETSNNDKDIDYYVISMKKEERLKNIEIQNAKLQKQIENASDTGSPIENNKTNIQIIDAVVGKDLDLDELVKMGKVSPEFHKEIVNNEKYIKNEIGCYSSHLKIYDIISNTKHTTGYSVIFEDDFVLDADFYKKMIDAIHSIDKNNIDFDMLMLGFLNNFESKHLIDNIYYYTNKNYEEKGYIGYFYGGHGYLINNKNIEKIKKVFQYISRPIDEEFYTYNMENKITIYKLKDSIVGQDQENMKSTIKI